MFYLIVTEVAWRGSRAVLVDGVTGRAAGGGRVTGTTVSSSSSPEKSPGLVVYRGNSPAIATEAIIRSVALRLGLRPAAITAAATRP
jgi:hypothetical protein